MTRPVKVGNRIILRHPIIRDCDEFLALVNQSRVFHHPWVYPPTTRQAYLTNIKRYSTPRHIGFFLCLKSNGAIVGVINLNEIVRGIFRSAYLGFYCMEPYAGKGYMTEGLQLLINHAFRKLKFHRLEANIQPTNHKSIALVKRCGFLKEGYSPHYLKIGGRWKDHERWAILSDAKINK